MAASDRFRPHGRSLRPEKVTDEGGQVRWRASYRTWGGAIEERWDAHRSGGR
ncbi:RHS domain-containing protein [Paracidovorax konjaci]|uniref:RHS domain-containing protein n=1 Tax=Paracidovorax konjaci TaxID=32040 RepID=UPI000B8653F4